LIYTASTLQQWELQGLDLATALLQTTPTEADDKLFTTGVPELCEALQAPPGSVVRILRNYNSTSRQDPVRVGWRAHLGRAMLAVLVFKA